MVKGIINAFDHMELCFVINLTKDDNWAITRPLIFALGYTRFCYYLFIPGSKYLQKKLISNTVHVIMYPTSDYGSVQIPWA